MDPFIKSVGLLFVLLNPLLMSVYLIDLIQTLDKRTFRRVVVRASGISGAVFILLAWTGQAIFTDVLQVRFSSFLLFGGLVFLTIALRAALEGPVALERMRGKPEHLSGSIAMPFMIGPATVSASIIVGQRLPFLIDGLAIGVALLLAVGALLAFKSAHDRVRKENERLLARYIEVSGRIMALVMGTFAVEMIVKGIDLWLGAKNGTGP